MGRTIALAGTVAGSPLHASARGDPVPGAPAPEAVPEAVIDIGTAGPPQVRLILAYLALHRDQRILRQELADLLWDDRVPATWDVALRGLMRRIRAFLDVHGIPPSALLTVHGCYRLCLPTDIEIDLDLAERRLDLAASALETGAPAAALLHAGAGRAIFAEPFLPSLEQPWVMRRRDLHRDAVARSLELTAGARAALGQHEKALAAAAEALRLRPLRESSMRAFMGAARGAGDRAEALDAYHGFRARMRRELGMAPSADTERLFLDILRQDAEAAGPGGEPYRCTNRDVHVDAALRALREQLVAGTGSTPTRERCSSLARLCQLNRWAGSAFEAEAAAVEAAAIARILRDPDLLAEVALANATFDRIGLHARGSGSDLVEEALAGLDAAQVDPVRPGSVRPERVAALRARRVQYLAGAHRGRAAAEGAAELAASVGSDAPPTQLMWVLAAALYAGGPGSDGLPSPRAAAAAGRELLTLARGRDPELVLLALEARSAALAALGDCDGAYALIGAYARLAEHEGASWPQFQVLLHRGFCAGAEGRFGECEQLAAEVARLGARLAPTTVVDALQMACLYVPRWLTGRTGDLLGPVQDLRRWLDAPEPAAAVAFLAAEGGFPDIAGEAFADVMRDPGPGGIEPGLLRDITLFNLVGACVRAGDADAAGELSEVLHPVADDNCVYAGRIFLGTYRFHLGRLAMTRGHWERAVADLGIALDRHRRARAMPWVALSAQALSDALTSAGAGAGAGAEARARAGSLRAEARWLAAKIGMRDPAELVGTGWS